MTDARAAVAEHLHIAHATAVEWSGGDTDMPQRHGFRTDRLRRAWPRLAALLDGLVESTPSTDEQAAVTDGAPAPRVACPVCGVVGTHLASTPDPRTGEQSGTASSRAGTRSTRTPPWRCGRPGSTSPPRQSTAPR